MALHKRSIEERIGHAEQIIEYYERFLGSGHSFRLGLYMAKQWRKYLVKERHDLNEIQLFVNAVKGGADTHGSGWQDLTIGVTSWFDDLEERGDTFYTQPPKDT